MLRLGPEYSSVGSWGLVGIVRMVSWPLVGESSCSGGTGLVTFGGGCYEVRLPLVCFGLFAHTFLPFAFWHESKQYEALTRS